MLGQKPQPAGSLVYGAVYITHHCLIPGGKKGERARAVFRSSREIHARASRLKSADKAAGFKQAFETATPPPALRSLIRVRVLESYEDTSRGNWWKEHAKDAFRR